jgi:hypothetical protein
MSSLILKFPVNRPTVARINRRQRLLTPNDDVPQLQKNSNRSQIYCARRYYHQYVQNRFLKAQDQYVQFRFRSSGGDALASVLQCNTAQLESKLTSIQIMLMSSHEIEHWLLNKAQRLPSNSMMLVSETWCLPHCSLEHFCSSFPSHFPCYSHLLFYIFKCHLHFW